MRLRPPNYQQRSRRRFLFFVIGIAIFAILLGALLAYFILVDSPKKRSAPVTPPAPPKPVEQFAEPIEAWDDEPTPELPDRPRKSGGGSRPRPESLDDDSIRTGLARLQGSFNECAREHGAVDGSLVRVGFSVSAEGQVNSCFALAPHARTPLGRCIVEAVARARLKRTVLGRQDVRWSIILHP